MQNAKPKPKKKGREAENGKENAGEKGNAVPIEIKDTEKAKPKIHIYLIACLYMVAASGAIVVIKTLHIANRLTSQQD